MSPAVEETGSGSPLPKIVGGTPTTTAKLAGVEVECLIDTGSMVTLLSETLYKQKLESVCGGVQCEKKMLTLRGANELEIPYLGYLELDVQVEGVTVPSCRVLVLKDTAATVEQRRRRPGVLGSEEHLQFLEKELKSLPFKERSRVKLPQPEFKYKRNKIQYELN